MYHIVIYSVGKTKEPWLQESLQEYTKRLSKAMVIEWKLCKDLEKGVCKEKSYICFDEKGETFTSEEFSTFLFSKGSRIVFVIGGADGLSPALKKGASHLISLSSFTFTHQLCRLILLEQLYRAHEIYLGSAYHRA